MDFVLGLDFGTHQSKLCLHYRPQNEDIFEFVEFPDEDGEMTPLFPSFVQINADGTMSYGFSFGRRSLGLPRPMPMEPEYPAAPACIDRPMPVRPSYPPDPRERELTWQEKLAVASGIDPFNRDEVAQWKRKCQRVDEKYDSEVNAWWVEQDSIAQWKNEVESLRGAYELDLESWKEDSSVSQEYRYFKLASFSDSFDLDCNLAIDADYVSVWYLTYLLLYTDMYLKRRFPDDYNSFEYDVAVQMGVPYGVNSSHGEMLLNHGKRLLISARILMGQFHSLDEFLSADYKTLLDIARIYDGDISGKADELGLVLMAEAFAGLRSLTNRKRLTHGNMHILVDIGGGTTDIAFFTIRDVDSSLEPDVHSVVSFHKGLNYVFECYQIEHPDRTLPEIQRAFRFYPENFREALSTYTRTLRAEINSMIDEVVVRTFNLTFVDHGMYPGELVRAMEGRPIVYCGGGSLYKSMRVENRYFNDVKLIDSSLMNIPNLQNEDIGEDIMPILATAYGLSIVSDGELVMTDPVILFEKLSQNKSSRLSSMSVKDRYDYDD